VTDSQKTGQTGGGPGLDRNAVVAFMLGLVATLGTVLGLGAIGGGAEIARRNALTELRVGGGLVLAGMCLAAVAVLSSRVQTALLIPSVLIGIGGLALAGWAITDRSPGRPAIKVIFDASPTRSALITVEAGGLASSDDLNLLAVAYRDAFGQKSRGALRLIRHSFGPNPAGDASMQAKVPIPASEQFRSIVIRAWVGDPEEPGRCLLEKRSRDKLKKESKTGCVIFPLGVA
jgi:hypothetical protein